MGGICDSMEHTQTQNREKKKMTVIIFGEYFYVLCVCSFLCHFGVGDQLHSGYPDIPRLLHVTRHYVTFACERLYRRDLIRVNNNNKK